MTKEEPEQRKTASQNQQHDDSPAPPAIPPHQNLGEDGIKILELSKKLESLELDARKAKDRLEESNGQKEALERDVSTLKSDNERMRTNNEALMTEKWELSAANTELKNRLQQSMAMSYMQVI